MIIPHRGFNHYIVNCAMEGDLLAVGLVKNMNLAIQPMNNIDLKQ